MSARHITYLISGANRGIGFGLVEKLLTSDVDSIVFAGVRDPRSATALTSLVVKFGDRLQIVQLESGNQKDAEAAAKLIGDKFGHLDVLIANAAVAYGFGPLATASLDAFREHFEVNTLGPLVLYQAFRDLLLKSPTKSPKFVGISTAPASLNDQMDMPAHAYLASKTAMNYLVTKIALEDRGNGIVAFALSPGWVQTDMGNSGAVAQGLQQAPVTLGESVNGILTIVAAAEQATHGGIFWDYTGSTYRW